MSFQNEYSLGENGGETLGMCIIIIFPPLCSTFIITETGYVNEIITESAILIQQIVKVIISPVLGRERFLLVIVPAMVGECLLLPIFNEHM